MNVICLKCKKSGATLEHHVDCEQYVDELMTEATRIFTAAEKILNETKIQGESEPFKNAL